MAIRPVIGNYNISFKKSEEYKNVVLRGRENFYNLDKDKKLNVIFDLLTSVDTTADKIAANQKRERQFNLEKFQLMHPQMDYEYRQLVYKNNSDSFEIR